MTPAQDIAQAKNAERLLNDPLIREFLDRLHEQIFKGFKNANIGDAERERLAALGRFADEFESYFKSCIQTGRMAEIRIQEEATQKEREHEAMARVRKLHAW